MDKNNSRRRYNRSKFNSYNSRNKYKNDVQPEQLSETDVGITEYISNLEGFSGILKVRFSDFQVNEIDANGEVAKFTDITEPAGFDSDSVNKEIPVPQETPTDIIPQNIWDEIKSIVDNDSDKVVELDSTGFDKQKREVVHCTVKSIFRKKIVATTITRDDKKFITFKKYNKEDKSEQRFTWPADKDNYVHFLVYKENVDTLEATLRISDCLRLKASLFNYAGVKDRRAKTTQWFSVKRVEPWKLLKKTRCLRNIHIGNITFKKRPLKLGKLQGNRFRIALRNITADNDLINKSMESLKENGFVNYYGLQRFGNDKEVPTYEIGVKLLLGNFKEACSLILKNKTCDNPSADISKAKKIYNETGSAEAAVKNLKENANNTIESKLLFGLAKSNINDYVNALEKVPRNMRLLYIHSFQALIWNKIVSRRIKEFGLKPIVGDLVLLKDDEIQDEENNEMEDEDLSENEDDKNDDKNDENSKDEDKIKRKEVKSLKEEDLLNYTIYDIVLPLPGYDVTYPDNIIKEWYKTLLEEYGLTLEMPKQSVKTYTLSGNYRPLISKVTNLSWKVMHYEDPNKDLIRSDFDEFLKRPEPEDIPDGQYKALVIDFCLQPSCYATMVVREILKTDTSISAHTKLNNYHQSSTKKDSIISTTNTETPVIDDTPAPNSLLSDPAKYEDFKKSIFGFTSTSSSEDSLKRKLTEKDNAVPEKKSKEENKEKESGLKLEPALV